MPPEFRVITLDPDVCWHINVWLIACCSIRVLFCYILSMSTCPDECPITCSWMWFSFPSAVSTCLFLASFTFFLLCGTEVFNLFQAADAKARRGPQTQELNQSIIYVCSS